MAIAIVVTVGLGWSIFMVAVGHATAASPSTTTASTMAARAVETYAASLPPTTRATTTSTAIPTTTAPQGLRDGTFVVGTDVEPGTYRSASTGKCYWARLSNFNGDDDIISNEFVSSGPAIVTIAAGDVGFKSQGCSRWERIG